MPFSRRNQADIDALYNEVSLDPLNMGYTVIQDGNVEKLLSELNDPANNVNPDLGPDFLTPDALVKVFFAENANSQDQFAVQNMFAIVTLGNEDLSRFRADLRALTNKIRDAIDAIVRNLNRAEGLFSIVDANGSQESIILSEKDWVAARDFNTLARQQSEIDRLKEEIY